MVAVENLVIGIIMIIIGIFLLFKVRKIVSYPSRRFVGILALIIGIATIISSFV
jgi:uncharacterized membrane protein HdeD (DUF308 family)